MGKVYLVGVLLSFLIFPMVNAAAQPQRQAASDLLLRMAAEREQFLTFRVESTVTGVLPDLTAFRQDWKTNNNSRTKIYQEFSRVDQHYITAVCDLVS